MKSVFPILFFFFSVVECSYAWTTVGPYGGADFVSFDVDPGNPNVILAQRIFDRGTRDDPIYKSTNGGVTWKGLNIAEEFDAACQFLPVPPFKILCAGDSAYLSSDLGNTWQKQGVLPSF